MWWSKQEFDEMLGALIGFVIVVFLAGGMIAWVIWS